jgi:hypothetical protein
VERANGRGCLARSVKLARLALLGLFSAEAVTIASALSRRATQCDLVKELPQTATGKIQKYVLRSQRTAIAPKGRYGGQALDRERQPVNYFRSTLMHSQRVAVRPTLSLAQLFRTPHPLAAFVPPL